MRWIKTCGSVKKLLEEEKYRADRGFEQKEKMSRCRGEKAVTVSGYWQKPLTVTALTVIKFH
jgi:hypothetical protein